MNNYYVGCPTITEEWARQLVLDTWNTKECNRVIFVRQPFNLCYVVPVISENSFDYPGSHYNPYRLIETVEIYPIKIVDEVNREVHRIGYNHLVKTAIVYLDTRKQGNK